MTAATMFMDVVTNFAPSGAKAWYPTQADHAERGPVRLRSALQFSLNIPAIKAGFINGLRHQFDADEGLRPDATRSGVVPVASESIGTLEVHPIDMISAFGVIGNGGVLMPRHTIIKVLGRTARRSGRRRTRRRRASGWSRAQAAYIITDILAGNTVKSVNPFWGKWRITNGVSSSKVRPAAYKTGTTSDNRDVLAFGYLAPPSDKKLPALVAGVWMGNSDNSPNDGKLSLDTSAPLWSAILSEASKGMKIEGFAPGQAQGPRDRRPSMRSPGCCRGPPRRRPSGSCSCRHRAEEGVRRRRSTVDVDEASGLLWQEGCVGPDGDAGVHRPFEGRGRLQGVAEGRQALAGARRARPGRHGRPEAHPGRPTSTAAGSIRSGGRWGGEFAPTKPCPLAPPPSVCVPGDPLVPCPSPAPEVPPPAQ